MPRLRRRTAAALPLRALDRSVFVGRAVRETGDPAEPRFSDPWPDALQDDVLQDRHVDRTLVHYLLDLVEDRRAFPAVEFDRLLLVESIDIGIAAIGLGAAFDDKSFQSGRGVAKGGIADLDDILEFLVEVSLEKPRSLERPQPG